MKLTADQIRDCIIAVLKQVYDPEIPVNIYALGLIYDVSVDDKGSVEITMTLTTPNCPVAESMPAEVEQCAWSVDGVNEVKVNLVWEPQWTIELMSMEARLELGLI